MFFLPALLNGSLSVKTKFCSTRLLLGPHLNFTRSASANRDRSKAQTTGKKMDKFHGMTEKRLVHEWGGELTEVVKQLFVGRAPGVNEIQPWMLWGCPSWHTCAMLNGDLGQCLWIG